MKFRNIAILAVLSAVSFTMLGCGGNEEKKSDWKKINTISIEQKNNIGGFDNKYFGITVGYAGEIHYTTDAGKTWPRASNTSFCRFGLDIIDKNIAWCCGNAGHVRKTTDGGKTWIAVKNFGGSEPDQCRYISFLDDKIGWVASPTLLGSTTDGGNTWNTLTLPDGIGEILAINLFDEKTGYVIDNNKKLYVTKDGGSTWESNSLGISDFGTLVYRTNGVALGFNNKNDGLLFYFDENSNLNYATTNDGGKTWTKQPKPKTSAYGPLYLSQDNKFLTVNTDSNTKLVVLKKK